MSPLGASIFDVFGISIGINTENDRYWQKLFTFCKSFENVQFLLAFALKVLQNFLLPYGIKKRRVYADFKFVDVSFKNAPIKSFRIYNFKKMRILSILVCAHFFEVFCV